MERETFSERNRRRRERNAFENLYEYNLRTGVPDPKRAAEAIARSLHGGGARPAAEPVPPRPKAAEPVAAEPAKEDVPHLLDDRTKEQLYARAKELDIGGRSQMTRDELIEAIRKHS